MAKEVLIGIFVAVIAGLILHYVFGIGKSKSPEGKIIMRNVKSTGNGGDGIRIKGSQNVDMDNVETYDNGGQGISTER
jgi:hypothetical protein